MNNTTRFKHGMLMETNLSIQYLRRAATRILLCITLAAANASLSIVHAQDACATQKGGLIVNEVWGPQNSPICLTNDTTLSNVTVLPGTVVRVASNVVINVLTVIRAIGTSNAPVVFEAAPENNSGWQGIYFNSTSPGSEFDWCIFRDANNSAIRLVRATPLVRNTVFEHNSGPYGGAIYASNVRGELIVTNCTFSNNSAVNDGGAIWSNVGTGRLDVINCAFDGNVANPSYQRRHTYGGAIQARGNTRIRQSTFRGSRVHAYTIYASGGIYTLGGAVSALAGNFEISGCKFLDNACEMSAHGQTPDTSHAFGAGIYLESGSMVLSNTLIAENWISAPRWPNPRGSAVYLNAGTLDLVNCTVVHNEGAPALHNASGTVTVRSSIIYFNFNDVDQLAGAATITYSTVQGGWEGVGNIDYNPALDAQYGLILGSPAIDAGDPSPAGNDVFPPGLGTARGDMGYAGGPGGALWIQPTPIPAQDVFRVETSQLILWIDRADLQLEHAVTVTGPWVTYTGETIAIGNQRAVLVQQTDPRRFFRLVKISQ